MGHVDKENVKFKRKNGHIFFFNQDLFAIDGTFPIQERQRPIYGYPFILFFNFKVY